MTTEDKRDFFRLYTDVFTSYTQMWPTKNKNKLEGILAPDALCLRPQWLPALGFTCNMGL